MRRDAVCRGVMAIDSTSADERSCDRCISEEEVFDDGSGTNAAEIDRAAGSGLNEAEAEADAAEATNARAGGCDGP